MCCGFSLFCEAKYLTALFFYKTPYRLLGKKREMLNFEGLNKSTIKAKAIA
jgi:hypothetical protein